MAIPAHLLVILAVFAVSPVCAAAASLPYIPTTILVPGSTTGTVGTTGTRTNENSTAYIFSPNDAGDSVALLAIDITSTLDAAASSTKSTTLTSDLPFVSSASNTSTFVPVLALDGSIVVFSGDCTSNTGSSHEVWVYNTSSATDPRPSWAKHSISSSSSDATTAAAPYFLGGALAFSDILSPSLSSPSIYAYGGQCPKDNTSREDDETGDSSPDADDWVSAADYTNAIVKLSPSGDDDDNNTYHPKTLALKAQPIAEAGFSFTPLRPSTSNISGTVTQSLNAVVLGGHTQSAFVNMSTAAVWSLPEESWSFISISGPFSSSTTTTSSELARADGQQQQAYASVDSRSGHTAVLNQEGSALVVLGGWVGNTSQAATPQLAVLQMNGSNYGEWTWTIPENQPLSAGQGIHGHGAALLPGNVMMISGGYSISPSSSSSPSASKRRPRRDDLGAANGQLKSFFNMTSMTWTDSYTNPSSSSSSSGTSSSPPATNTTELGLGLGLGLGIPVLLLLVALAIYCIRRRRRYRHAVRDEHMRSLASGHAFITSEEMLERHDGNYLWGGGGPAGASRWHYPGGHDPYMRDEKSLGYESLRGSRSGGGGGGGGGLPQVAGDVFDSEPMAVEPVAPYKNALRRKPAPRVAKGLYQPTGVDESRALGAIHPILEDEEDEMSAHGAMSPDEELEGEGGEDDPFMTPAASPTRERERLRDSTSSYGAQFYGGPSSPAEAPRTPARPQHPEVQDWVTDIDASDALITARIQRRSTTTARNTGRATTPPPPTRRQSLREEEGGARTDSNLSESNRSAFSFMPSRADSLRVAAAAAANGGQPTWSTSSNEKREGTSHSDHSSSDKSNTSYATAKSISALQAEGPQLLLGRPRAISEICDVADEDPGSPSKSKPPRRSWLGSLRRVFSTGHGSSDGSSSGNSDRTDSPARGESGDYDRLGLGSLGLGGIGLLQKRRLQGRSAWGPTTTTTTATRTGGDAALGDSWAQDEDDWDIERAVEQRLVQVMFSVPRERLRVVNGDPEILSLAESAVVVDLTDANAGGGGSGAATATMHHHDSPLDLDESPLPPIQEDEKATTTGDKGKQRMNETPVFLVEAPPCPPILDQAGEEKERRPDDEITPSKREVTPSSPSSSSKRPALLLKVPSLEESDLSEPPSASGSLSRTRNWTPSPGVPMTAEEVRFSRPRSRVLAMVEQLEGRSRSNSPSPTKGGFRGL